MSILLQPGIMAPDFKLSAAEPGRTVSLAEHRGKNLVLFFFPFPRGEDLFSQLVKYQERAAGFAEQGAGLIGMSDASQDSLLQLAREQGIEFPLLSDSEWPGNTAALYGVRSDEGVVMPALFIIDGECLIRRVYGPGSDASLPNPAMVARALNKLTDTPKPGPVTEDDWRWGPREAPIVLIEYSDYQCARCAELHDLLGEFLPGYGGRVMLVHRHYLLRHSHPQAQAAAEAADAAGAQGKFWEMHHRLFAAQQRLEREQLVQCAEDVRLDMDRFLSDLDDRRYETAVNEKFRLAVSDKVKFPPALFINKIPFEGPRSRDAIRARIDTLLACMSQIEAISGQQPRFN